MAAPDFVTLAEAKAQLETTTTASDALIAALITAASTAPANRYQREFTPKSTATRRFSLSGSLIDLAPFDLRSVSSVTLHPEDPSPVVLTSADYSLEPVGSALGGSYFMLRLSQLLNLFSSFASRFGYAQIDITGAWGIFDTADVPADLKRACITTVGSWLDRAVAEYAAGGYDERGLRPPSTATWAIPFSAHLVYKPYERMSL